MAVGYGEGSDIDGFVSNTTIWDQTDITYLLRGTIIADPPVINFGTFAPRDRRYRRGRPHRRPQGRSPRPASS